MLRADMLPYRDADGLVVPNGEGCSPTQYNVSGNGVLYTGEYVLLMRLNGELNDSDRKDYRDVIEACMPVEKGLLSRSPTHSDQEGPDDYIGLAVGAWATGNNDLAEAVITYGKKHYGFFNNENPGSYYHKDGRFNWSALLIRQPQLIGIMYYAANRVPPFLIRLYLAIGILISGRNKPLSDSDARILAWLVINVVDNRCWMIKIAARVFTNRLLKQYDRGMTDVISYYFQDPHPFRKHWPKV